MWRPNTPPALLALSTASLAALSMSIPAAAYCPLSCAKKPSLMVPLAAGREETVAVAGAAMPAKIRTTTLNKATSVLLTRTMFTSHLPFAHYNVSSLIQHTLPAQMVHPTHGCAVAGRDIEHLRSPWPRSAPIDGSTVDIGSLVRLLFVSYAHRVPHSCDDLSEGGNAWIASLPTWRSLTTRTFTSARRRRRACRRSSPCTTPRWDRRPVAAACGPMPLRWTRSGTRCAWPAA